MTVCIVQPERLSGKTQETVMRQSELSYVSSDDKRERGVRRDSSAYLNERRAYILGAFLGDGSLGEYNMRLTCKDLDIVEFLAECFDIEFDKLPMIRQSKGYKGYPSINIGSAKIRVFLRHHCTKLKHYPEDIFSATDEEKKFFIAGLMDTDGTICKTERLKDYGRISYWQYCMAFGTTSCWFDLLKMTFAELGVKCGKTGEVVDKRFSNARKAYHFTIKTRSYLDAGCFFKASRKQHLLDDYAANIKAYR